MRLDTRLICFLKSSYTVLRAIHLNPALTWRALLALPDFFQQRKHYLKLQATEDWPANLQPVLLDGRESSATLGEYFWQDTFVARQIIKSDPGRHIDVGSRVDGFIAHLSCVRRVEVFDIRPLAVTIENVTFQQWDLTKPKADTDHISDCVSCLHTLEHIGLGRYGDPLDPDGWRKGLASLARLLKPGGTLWLSVPIGVQRVQFNAHRVFSPETIHEESKRNLLNLISFHFLADQELISSTSFEADFARLGSKDYSLGIFQFRKSTDAA